MCHHWPRLTRCNFAPVATAVRPPRVCRARVRNVYYRHDDGRLRSDFPPLKHTHTHTHTRREWKRDDAQRTRGVFNIIHRRPLTRPKHTTHTHTGKILPPPPLPPPPTTGRTPRPSIFFVRRTLLCYMSPPSPPPPLYTLLLHAYNNILVFRFIVPTAASTIYNYVFFNTETITLIRTPHSPHAMGRGLVTSAYFDQI